MRSDRSSAASEFTHHLLCQRRLHGETEAAGRTEEERSKRSRPDSTKQDAAPTTTSVQVPATIQVPLLGLPVPLLGLPTAKNRTIPTVVKDAPTTTWVVMR